MQQKLWLMQHKEIDIVKKENESLKKAMQEQQKDMNIMKRIIRKQRHNIKTSLEKVKHLKHKPVELLDLPNPVLQKVADLLDDISSDDISLHAFASTCTTLRDIEKQLRQRRSLAD